MKYLFSKNKIPVMVLVVFVVSTFLFNGPITSLAQVEEKEGSVFLPEESECIDDLDCLSGELFEGRSVILDEGEKVTRILTNSDYFGYCGDGIDNDGDGLTDINDPGCKDGSSDSEYNVERVSVAYDGDQSNAQSYSSQISYDGRYVSFFSVATNLLLGGNKAGIFIHDRLNKVTFANDNSVSSGCESSVDGRYITYTQNNPITNVYVRDTLTNEVVLASVSTEGDEANAVAYRPCISGNGQFVTFTSVASNLVEGDTNGKYDIYIRDLKNNKTIRASISSSGDQGINQYDTVGSQASSISYDGRHVVFVSGATLESSDTNNSWDIYVHDQTVGETFRVSLSSDGEQGNSQSDSPSISSDGRYVLFRSYSTNFLSGNTPRSGLFVKNLETGEIKGLGFALNGENINSFPFHPEISLDGRFVTFTSGASNLVEYDSNGTNDIFVDHNPLYTEVVYHCSDGKDNDGDYRVDYPNDLGCDSPEDNNEKDGVVLDINITNNSVDENSAIGATIGSFSTLGGVPPYTYRLVSGEGSEDNDKFYIDGGDLKLNFVPDFEKPMDMGGVVTDGMYSIRTMVKDSAMGELDGVDYSSAIQSYGSIINAPNYPNMASFAVLKTDGSIVTWGASSYGGYGGPIDIGYTKIYSTAQAFAALKADGSIKAWGNSNYGGLNAPSDNGYIKIFSNFGAFAALKADGSIKAWGNSNFGGLDAPTDSGYIEIYSTYNAFAALKADGSIKAWGNSNYGVTVPPTDTGYVKIYSNGYAFAALKADGSIKAWGSSNYGGSNAPNDSGYIKIYTTGSAFAALKANGSIVSWGGYTNGGSGAPSDVGYVSIYSTSGAFAALKADGSITAWGNSSVGGIGAPIDSGYIKIYSNAGAFTALKENGSIVSWGSSIHGGIGTPVDFGYIKIYSTYYAFAALKADGSITVWGDSSFGGSDSPNGGGFTDIYSTFKAFAALRSDGSIVAWGDLNSGGSGAPTGLGYIMPYGDRDGLSGNTVEKKFLITINDVEVEDDDDNSSYVVKSVSTLFPIEEIEYNNILPPSYIKTYFWVSIEGELNDQFGVGKMIESNDDFSFVLSSNNGVNTYDRANIVKMTDTELGADVLLSFQIPFEDLDSEYSLNLSGYNEKVQIVKKIKSIKVVDYVYPELTGGVWKGLGGKVEITLPVIGEAKAGVGAIVAIDSTYSGGSKNELSYYGDPDYDTMALGYPVSSQTGVKGEILVGADASFLNLIQVDANLAKIESGYDEINQEIEFPFLYNISRNDKEISDSVPMIAANMLGGITNYSSRLLSYFYGSYSPYKKYELEGTKFHWLTELGTVNISLGPKKEDSIIWEDEAMDKWKVTILEGGFLNVSGENFTAFEAGVENNKEFYFFNVVNSKSLGDLYLDIIGLDRIALGSKESFKAMKAGYEAPGEYMVSKKITPQYHSVDGDGYSLVWHMNDLAFLKLYDEDGSIDFENFDELEKNSQLNVTEMYELPVMNYYLPLNVNIGVGVGVEGGIALGVNSSMSIPTASYVDLNGELFELSAFSGVLKNELDKIKEAAPHSGTVIANSLAKNNQEVLDSLNDMFFGYKTEIMEYIDETGKSLIYFKENLDNKVVEIKSKTASIIDNFVIDVRRGFMNPPAQILDNNMVLASEILSIGNKNSEEMNEALEVALFLRQENEFVGDVNLYTYNGGWKLFPAFEAGDGSFVFTVNKPGVFALAHSFVDDSNFFENEAITILPQSNTEIASRRILMSNGEIAANQAFELNVLRSAVLTSEGKIMESGKYPVTIPEKVYTNADGILLIPLISGVQEGEIFISLKAEKGYADQVIRVMVSNGISIDNDYDFKVSIVSPENKIPEIGEQIIVKSETSNNTENISWYVKNMFDQEETATGSILYLTADDSGIFKIKAIAVDDNGFSHFVYTEIPVTDINSDFNNNGLSDDLDDYYGFNNSEYSSLNPFDIFFDNSAPETVIEIKTGDCDEKTIILDADDRQGSGVKRTEYSFDNINWKYYTGPIRVTIPGFYVAYFKSTDVHGNIEATKSVDFTVLNVRCILKSVLKDLESADLLETNEATRQIELALNEKFWIDDNHLEKNGGQSVFSHLENAIRHLDGIEGITELKNKIVLAVDIITTLEKESVSDIESTKNNTKEVDKATDKMEEYYEEAKETANPIEKIIDFFGKTWQTIMQLKNLLK